LRPALAAKEFVMGDDPCVGILFEAEVHIWLPYSGKSGNGEFSSRIEKW
jgi:hypothetical protein